MKTTKSKSKKLPISEKIMTAPSKDFRRTRAAIVTPIDPVKEFMLKNRTASEDDIKKFKKSLEKASKDVGGAQVKEKVNIVEKKKETPAVEEKKADELVGKKAVSGKKPLKKEKEVVMPKEKKVIVKKEKKEVVDEKYTMKSIIDRVSFPVSSISLKDENNKLVEGYVGILNKSTKKVISVVSEDYKILPNKVIIDPVLNFLDKAKVKYECGRLTYATDQSMRLHLLFPEIKIKDDSKEGIVSSIFLDNSYNMTKSFRMTAGAFRLVCSNGMVVGTVIKKLKVIHQAEDIQAIAVANIEAVINGFYDNVEAINKRIKELRESKVSIKLLTEVGNKFDSRVLAHVMKDLELLDKDDMNTLAKETLANLSDRSVSKFDQWKVYNSLTYHISHEILQRYRVDYLQKVSKVFEL